MAPITKSQQIRSLVKLILKKLIKKFSYEIICESIFSNEVKPKKVVSSIDDIDADQTKRVLTSVIRQGLENLLTNLKKAIEVEKKRKTDEQNKKSSKPSDNADLISMYTTKSAAAATNYNNE